MLADLEIKDLNNECINHYKNGFTFFLADRLNQS